MAVTVADRSVSVVSSSRFGMMIRHEPPSLRLAKLTSLAIVVLLALRIHPDDAAATSHHIAPPASLIRFEGAARGLRQSRATSGDDSPDVAVHEREFVSPQVSVRVDCQRDKTLIGLNFTQPFAGLLGAGRLDSTTCKLSGDGASRSYQLQVPHNATQCQAQWDNSTSSISNTLFIRFHQALETGNDITMSVMCRLTVGDLVVGRRPLKKAQQKRRTSSNP